MAQKVTYGGQAVIEGVMMRGPDQMAIAVRRPGGDIALHQQPIGSVTRRYPVLGWPIVRGMVALVETVGIGITALLYSANQAAPEEEQLSRREMTLTTVLGLVLAVGLFIILPTVLMGLVKGVVNTVITANVIEGLLRILIFVAYIVVISRMEDVQRVFQYHGAEHKVINTLEAGEDLTVANVRRHTLLHRRCGTTFLLYVMVVAILLFSLVGWPNFWVRILSRLLLLPVVAGLAYEIIKFTATVQSPLLGWLIQPGLWLQKLTTREPDDSQIEVAIEALKGARERGDDMPLVG